MKRITSILLIFFVVYCILNNFVLSITYLNDKHYVINRESVKSPLYTKKTIEDTTNVKEDTILIITNTKIEIIKESPVIDIHDATWYRTNGTRVHREHPTAAYNKFPKGTKLKVTNIRTGDTCIVEVTDRMVYNAPNKIDLSHSAFGILDNHSKGRIKVKVEKIQ